MHGLKDLDEEFMFCRSPTTTAIAKFVLDKKKAYLFSVKSV